VIIVAGYLTVAEAERSMYLDDRKSVVAEARTTEGCLEFSLSADLLDTSRTWSTSGGNRSCDQPPEDRITGISRSSTQPWCAARDSNPEPAD
jgi:hypothetical protein